VKSIPGIKHFLLKFLEPISYQPFLKNKKPKPVYNGVGFSTLTPEKISTFANVENNSECVDGLRNARLRVTISLRAIVTRL
jgi:hypothetical protein